MKRVLILLTLGFLIASLFFTGCGGKEIKVGSKMDPESLLLAQMMIQLLSENGYRVIDKTPTGNTYDLIDAIKNKDIDICLEYTGNIGEYVKNKAEVEWLKPGPADNKWGIAVPASILTILSDNRTLSNFFYSITKNSSMANIKIICSYEFTVNQNALPAFQKMYEFELEHEQLFIVPGSNTEQMAKLADDNKWATMAFTTDGHLDKYNLVLLEDNCNAQEDFHPAPVVHNVIYEKIPREDLNRILMPLFASLDDETLKNLNSQIGLRGSQAISEVARQYLIENGYFRYDERQMVQDAVDEMIRRNDGKIPGGIDFSANNRKPTNKMAEFPNEDYRIYFGKGSIRGEEYEYQNGEDTLEGYRLNWSPDKNIKSKNTKPDYAKKEDINKEQEQWLGPPLTIYETRGTYSCDANGIVTQESTGW